MSVNGEDDENKRLKVQIREKDLLCINGCGFYGTPQWENYCSKCWRAHQVVMKRNKDFAKNRTLLSFDQFQERRKSSTESRSLSIKKIFKSPTILTSSSSNLSGDGSATNSSATMNSSSPVTTPTRRRAISPETEEARSRLKGFLAKNLPSPIVSEVSKSVNNAILRIRELRIPPDDLSELVQNYYQYLADMLNSFSFFTDPKCTTTVDKVLEEIETYICTSCYSYLFCASSDEEVADVSLQDRIRTLNWVTAGFLETKLLFKKQAVRDKLDEAIAQIIEVNSKRSTSDKFDCLVKCSHFIFEALRESGAPTSADEFLPVLIFVLLRGNPPLIQSNVKFISRFALQSKVMSGESGYFFTNLSCALQFVQDMNHDSLKMSKTEFEAYTSGHLSPPLNIANCACNQALFAMESSMDDVNLLIEKQNALVKKIDLLDNRIECEVSDMISSFTEKMSLYPSKKYDDLRAKILEAEKMTEEAFKAFSRQSSDSGRGTLTAGTVPSSPQPKSDETQPSLIK